MELLSANETTEGTVSRNNVIQPGADPEWVQRVRPHFYGLL